MKRIAELIWELLASLFTLALLGFVCYAIYRKEWGEATIWLVCLILDRMPRRSEP